VTETESTVEYKGTHTCSSRKQDIAITSCYRKTNRVRTDIKQSITNLHDAGVSTTQIVCFFSLIDDLTKFLPLIKLKFFDVFIACSSSKNADNIHNLNEAPSKKTINNIIYNYRRNELPYSSVISINLLLYGKIYILDQTILSCSNKPFISLFDVRII
jgi:hypothetical protein